MIIDEYYCKNIIYVNNYLWLLAIISDYFMIIDNYWQSLVIIDSY